ncbi:WG repeat-containing protein [Candidatus Obscuribacterales bacterium]|nr:WG repeat-containing protein [Candidatus Obscuribacterales bacterium]
MNVKQIAVLSLFISLSFSISSTLPADAKKLAGLWNTAGKIVLPLEYDEIRRESNKFFAYKSQALDNGKIIWTRTEVDLDGHIGNPLPSEPPQNLTTPSQSNVKPPEGWNVQSRYDFGYSVSNDKGQRGFVDASGKLLVIPDTMTSAEPIGPGLFLNQVYRDNSEPITQLLDSELKVISEIPKDLQLSGEYYRDGLLMVRTKSGIIAFLNAKGQYQIKPSAITNARKFINGFCEVTLQIHGQSAVAIIDKNGKIVAGPFEGASFHRRDDDDQVVVEFRRNRAGVISVSGKEIIPFEYDSMIEHDGLYVGRKDGHCIIFSHEGKVLVSFENSITSVVPSGKYIIFSRNIDTKGITESAQSASHRQIRTGVMRWNGQVIIPAQFERTGSKIQDGLLLTYSSENSITKTGVVNVETGKAVIQPIAGTVTIEDGYIMVSMRNNIFDAAQFKQKKGRAAWSDFLQTYNLIGMRKSKIEFLLGKPDSGYVATGKDQYGRYGLECGYCLNTWRGVDIEYDSKNKAIGWREVERSTPDEWHRDNVVMIDSTIGGNLRTVPKRDAKTFLLRQPKSVRST